VSEIKKQKRVVLFTAPGCHWCVTAKTYLKSNGVKFKNIDISRDESASKDCQRHGCKGVPAVMIGNKWICGFDKSKIAKELGL